MEASTIFVLVTDRCYFNKTQVTINDLRTIGSWKGEIALITIDFDLDQEITEQYNIINVRFPLIDKTLLKEKIGPNGFINWAQRFCSRARKGDAFWLLQGGFTKASREINSVLIIILND